MAVRGSATFIWLEDHRLGGGAFGEVYHGRHRKRGNSYAVKVFKPNMKPQYVALKKREVLICQKLSHENIVKVIAVEQEKVTRDSVIIMELCDGGSLQSVLDKPENAYGLKEHYYLLLLSHIVAGLAYLNQQRIVHRDIKPANILIRIEDDNSHCFKLTDFGGSHELQGGDNDAFQSMFGTEEFLYPPMFKAALLGGAKGQLFNSSVDLWSCGITLYQAATGRLPFKPINGRKDRQMMYQLIGHKETGVIGGVELVDGSIKWIRELPETCHLSRGLRDLLTPMLARLLEGNPKEQLAFKDFFNQAEEIQNKEVIHVFSLLTYQQHTLYMRKDSKWSRLQDCIAQCTDIAVNDQLLLYNDASLTKHVSADTAVSQYPPTSKDSPITLLPRSGHCEDTHRPIVPELPELQSPEGDYLVAEAKWAKHCVAYGMFITSLVESLTVALQLMKKSMHSLRFYCQAASEKAGHSLESLNHVFSETAMRAENWRLNCSPHRAWIPPSDVSDDSAIDAGSSSASTTDNSASSQLKPGVKSSGPDLVRHSHQQGCEIPAKMRHTLETLEKYRLKKEHLSGHLRMGPWLDNDPLMNAQLLSGTKCAPKMERLVERISMSCKVFQDLKAKTSLSHNDEQILRFEKKQLHHWIKDVQKGFAECSATLLTTYNITWQALDPALAQVKGISRQDHNIKCLTEKLKQFSQDIHTASSQIPFHTSICQCFTISSAPSVKSDSDSGLGRHTNPQTTQGRLSVQVHEKALNQQTAQGCLTAQIEKATTGDSLPRPHKSTETANIRKELPHQHISAVIAANTIPTITVSKHQEVSDEPSSELPADLLGSLPQTGTESDTEQSAADAALMGKVPYHGVASATLDRSTTTLVGDSSSGTDEGTCPDTSLRFQLLNHGSKDIRRCFQSTKLDRCDREIQVDCSMFGAPSHISSGYRSGKASTSGFREDTSPCLDDVQVNGTCGRKAFQYKRSSSVGPVPQKNNYCPCRKQILSRSMPTQTKFEDNNHSQSRYESTQSNSSLQQSDNMDILRNMIYKINDASYDAHLSRMCDISKRRHSSDKTRRLTSPEQEHANQSHREKEQHPSHQASHNHESGLPDGLSLHHSNIRNIPGYMSDEKMKSLISPNEHSDEVMLLKILRLGLLEGMREICSLEDNLAKNSRSTTTS